MAHTEDHCPTRRGCPDCTGLTWAELHDREADREESARDQQRMHDDHDYDWRTR